MGITPQAPQNIRTASTVPLAVAKVTASQLVRDTPQLPDARFQEFHDTDHIVQDLQTGTITERWILAGSPTEAEASGALQHYQRGDPHLKHVDHFVVRREFKYYTHSDDANERLTMMTITWQRMPCPSDYSVDILTVLVPFQSWWTWENQPQLLTRAPSGISVSRPLQRVTLRIPITTFDLKLTMTNNDEIIGRTNNDEFLEHPPGYWLLEDFRARHLYGPHGLFGAVAGIGTEPTFEVSITLRGDPWRHHERWEARWPTGLTLLPPPVGEEGPPGPLALIPERPIAAGDRSPTFAEMRAAHNVFTPYPQSERDFSDIIPREAQSCMIEELSKP